MSTTAGTLPRTELKMSAVERLLDALADAVLVVDVRGVVRHVNGAARRLLGVTAGMTVAHLNASIGVEAVKWLERALQGSVGGGSIAAPNARLNDGRSALLGLLPLDGQRFALHVSPLSAPPAPPTESQLISLEDQGTEVMRLFWESSFPATLEDLDHRLVAVNRAYVDFTGFPESMLLGMDPLSLQPEEDRAVNIEFRKQGQGDPEDGAPAPMIERRIIDAAGRERWFRAIRRRVTDARGRTLLLSLLQDATEDHHSRNQAERSLSELEQWLDLSPLGMVLIDGGGLVVRSNASFEAMVGTAPVSMADASPELRQLLGWTARGPRHDLQPNGAPLQIEVSLPQPDGDERHLRAIVRCAETALRQRRYLVVVQDCSVEEERDLVQTQLGALVDAAGIGVATFHESRGWLRGATAASGLLSGPMQAIGRDIVEPSSLPEYERLQRALRDGERAEVRYAVRHPDIGARWLLTRVTPGPPVAGKRMTSVVTLDVTEQQTSRERSEELLRELGIALDSSPAGIAYLRGDRLVRCNRRFERMLGIDGMPPTGTPLACLAAAHERAAELIGAALQALQTSTVYETEFQYELPAGAGPLWYSLSVRRAVGSDRGAGAIEATAVLTDVTRLKAQQSEKESLAREHELMFNLSDVGIAYLRGGRIERANDAMARLVGHDPKALVGLEVASLFESEAEYRRATGGHDAAPSGHGRWSSECRLKRADGRLIWVLASMRLARDGDREGGLIASYVNVDDRHRAERSLSQQADRTRAILDSVLIGIVTVDAGGIRWMNRSARRMFGGDLPEFVGQPMSIVATDDPDHPLRQGDLLQRLGEGEAETFECRLRARDGRVFWVAGNVVLTGRDSDAPQLTFALLDIDRRRHAEAARAQTQASLKRIIDTAPVLIVLHEARSHAVLQANPIAAQVLGRSEAEMLGQPIERLCPPELSQQLHVDLQAALADPDRAQRREYELVGPRNEPRVWEARHIALTSRDGGPPDQLLTIAADITEQRQAEAARLEAVIAQREMLVREVHHRIKNNLQGVAGLLQQVAQRRPEVAPAIAEAVGQVQAIAQVYGLQVGAVGPLRVKSVVEAIAGSVHRLHGRPIGVAVQGDEPHAWALPEVESIPIALLLNELLNNAVKHADAGAIGCTLAFGADSVRIVVDNPGRLLAGFDIARVPVGVSGLGLVRALLPRRGAALAFAQHAGRVLATVDLTPPAVTRLTPL